MESSVKAGYHTQKSSVVINPLFQWQQLIEAFFALSMYLK